MVINNLSKLTLESICADTIAVTGFIDSWGADGYIPSDPNTCLYILSVPEEVYPFHNIVRYAPVYAQECE